MSEEILEELTTRELSNKVRGLRYMLYELCPKDKLELVERITELEQQLAKYIGLYNDQTDGHVDAIRERQAAEAKLTKQDKLLDECQQYLERVPDYPVFVRLLTKLRDRKNVS